jgi:hypothetical protein
MTEVIKLSQSIQSAYITPMVRIFNAQYVTLYTDRYESEYIYNSNECTDLTEPTDLTKPISRETHTLNNINRPNIKWLISPEVVNGAIYSATRIYTNVRETAAASCIIL